MLKLLTAALAICTALAAVPAAARVEQSIVHSASLEGSLEGNSPDRNVYVILPPSYDKAKHRRYPVLYFLHGFTATAQISMDYIKFGEAVEQFASQNEMIVVVPDSFTKFGGSFYASGPTVGNFENFIARDLVRWVDGRYRTLARRESRGLAGHSMGGYGTFRIGMKYPDTFSSLYAMSACCLSARRGSAADAKYETGTPEDALKAAFFDKAYYATMVAFSPNPGRRPFFADPITQGGVVDPLVEARWAANARRFLSRNMSPRSNRWKPSLWTSVTRTSCWRTTS